MPDTISERQAFQQFGNFLKDLFAQTQQRKGITTTGASARGIEVRASDLQLQLVDTEGYIEFEDFGRGPGKWPPYSSILEWVELKIAGNIRDNIKNESLAFLIQRKIGEEGSLAFRTKKPTGVLTEVINPKYIDPFVASLVERHTIKVRTDVIHLFDDFKIAA